MDQVLNDYAYLEKGDADTWNPLRDDYQLVYRLGQFHALAIALRESATDCSQLSVVDLGCGNGRSTRMYIDLGFRPEQLRGLDLRDNAIEHARKLNPAIRFDTTDGSTLPFADGSVPWLSLSTVMSSIKGQEMRKGLAAEIYRVLAPGGHMFYFDQPGANDFAGGDQIDPASLFLPMQAAWQRSVMVRDFLPERSVPNRAVRLDWTSWRLGASNSLLAFVPRPDGLGAAIKQFLPTWLYWALTPEPPRFETFLFRKTGR